MKTGIVKMPTEDGNYYLAFTFTIEEFSKIFKKNNMDIIEKIRKPVFTSFQDVDSEEKYQKHLEIELKYSKQDLILVLVVTLPLLVGSIKNNFWGSSRGTLKYKDKKLKGKRMQTTNY